MAYYKDLRDYLKTLEQQERLIRIKRMINKDTEMHPLMRLQFRGLAEEERKGFLFESITDSKGRRYDASVACAVLGASEGIYALGMMCRPEEIGEKWTQAQLHPLEPRLIASGPVHEEVHTGPALLEHGGFDEFPIPISTPGWDVAPYLTSGHLVTKDPETGIRNVGNYRIQVKSPTRLGIYFGGRGDQHSSIHWRKCRERNVPFEAAVIVGTSPNISYTAVSKFGYGVDELAVAGGISGEPVELVQCRAVDLAVPAYAEVVFEGEISLTEVEPEGPFGEAGGYMAQRRMAPIFTVKCITHRKRPVWQGFVSQLAPSESSKLKHIAWQNNLYARLRHEMNMPQVVKVAFHDDSPGGGFVVIQMDRKDPAEVWQALEAAGQFPVCTKTVIAVDTDIDPWDKEAVAWALNMCMQPHRDCRIIKAPALGQDHSAEPLDKEREQDSRHESFVEGSRLLLDATRKWPYPPVSLPKKEFMEAALKIWSEEGLPALKLRQPWYGYNLGYWSEEEDEQAMWAVRGDYYRTGEVVAQRRKKI